MQIVVHTDAITASSGVSDDVIKKLMIAGGFSCQRYGFNVGANKFSQLTIENGKTSIKPKISLRQAASLNIA